MPDSTPRDYSDFLARKQIAAPAVGVDVPADALHPALYPFQRDLTRWALRKGRAAIFADTGLGKTLMQLAWAQASGVRTLLLAPLAVAQQTEREAAKWGIAAAYAKTAADAPAAGITITNYERLERFDPADFGAVVLDESSILKAMDGKTRTKLIETFRDTPLRLCCTATPAPNDIAEIANHAELLGILTRAELLATFFIHDDAGWRLKGHARDPFYAWLASWGMTLKRPSDLGYDDAGYDLPPLAIEATFLPTSYTPPGQLFPTTLKGITERAVVRRDTIAARVDAAVALVAAEPDEPWLLWVGMNDEGRLLAQRIPDAALVEGADAPERKAEMLMRFADGGIQALITKPSIAGMGLNLQRCARMAFVGLSDSYESYYQAIRRCWRYGQTRPVRAHIVLTDPERVIYDNVLRKEREAETLGRELVKHLAAFERAEIGHARSHDDYAPKQPMRLPAWLKGVAA